MNPDVQNVIIIIVIAVILFMAVKSSIKHFKGEGSCCGGGGGDVLVNPKKLGSIVSVKKIGIEGMHCKHCSTRIQNVLNSMEGINAKVKLSRDLAIVKTDREIDDAVIFKAIEDLGYKVKR